MSQIKNLTITTLDTSDTNAMFEAICKKIIHLTPLQAKKQILGFTGDDKVIENHKVTLGELISVISTYDIESHLKVVYVESEETKPFVAPDLNVGLTKTEGAKAMEEQGEMIKKPDANNFPETPSFLD